jgi:small subunit ribosomal protein S17
MEKKTTQKNIETKSVRKTLNGTVMSDKMKDTCVVMVERYVKDEKYQKFVNSRKRFQVHDAGNTAKVGDKVMIESCRPMSRHKSFKLAKILTTAKVA